VSILQKKQKLMSAETYHLGSTSAPITLSVAVSTPGIADTDLSLINAGTLTSIPVISGPTGNLTNISVGDAVNLNGQSIGITTTVDLASVASGLWPTLLNSLVIHYVVSGGADGVKTFTNASNERVADSTGQRITANKLINLVA
jgi:hypothetical protein